MSEINDGGPAFPTTPVSHGYAPDTHGSGTGCGPGMTMRDYLAAHETLSDIDHSETVGPSAETAEKLAGRPMPKVQGVEWLLWEADWRAAWKYMRADAMLAARSKPKV